MSNNLFRPTTSVLELTQVLESVIQDQAIPDPQTISIFFDVTEVYRHQMADGTVFWWGAGQDSTSAETAPLPCVSSR